MNILIADDDPVAVEFLHTILHAMGHEVRVCGTGTEAWDSFNADPTRVVISDWDMPGLDGPSLCQMIRSRPKTPYVYFILITAVHTDEANYNDAIRADVDDFLIKPIDRAAIWRRLHVARRILNFSTEVNRLKLLLPICTFCKKIRDDGDYWHQIEEYINTQTGTGFSHSICPDCATRMITGNFRHSDDIG